MTTKVKICGITNLADAVSAVDCGADALGFNFYRGSKRFVAPEIVSGMVASLPSDVSMTGVFVNERPEQIVAIATKAGLDSIQLHGEESLEYVDELRSMLDLPIIKAFRVSGPQVVNEVAPYRVDGVLLDANSARARGGTGETFDWSIAKTVAENIPMTYLAGGLSPENVADAIRVVRPYAVDACSLLESELGKKDRHKMAKFIAAAKGAL